MTTAKPSARDLDSALLPFAPLLYVAWADGELTDVEIASIRSRIEGAEWLDDESRQRLGGWLDPETPPSAAALTSLLTHIRRAAEDLSPHERRSLADLGVELSRARDTGIDWQSPQARRALDDIENALAGPATEISRELSLEISREILLPIRPEPEPEPAAPTASFDLQEMRRLLAGHDPEVRARVFRILERDGFDYRYGLPKEEHREVVLDWCRQLAAAGIGASSYPGALGGRDDMGRFVSAFEALAFFDQSLVVKFGVQFGLFGGSVLFLGTEQHHQRYLREIGTLELPGAFAMTEAGHGSNVRDIETTAVYDARSDEFVIDTPSESARKEYIGNAADHGRMATVFAQLRIGDDEFGVHAFLVPIRGEDGAPAPGVRIEDCGEKVGLNGVDNGRLWFERVRVPRTALLDRYGQVSASGEYSSPIRNPSARFFTMLGTLVGGRVAVSAASLSAAKAGLAIAIRYAEHRRQFGPAGEAETLLLDYPSHQIRLLPRLARAYATEFAVHHLLERFLARSEEDHIEVEHLAAGIKAFSSWGCADTLQACREACGGAGYLAVNRLGSLRADTDVYTTFEGDNVVLLQLLAKGLLTEFRQEFGENRLAGLARHLGRRAAIAITELNPITTRIADRDHLLDQDFQRSALRYRADRLLLTVAQRLRSRIAGGMDSHQAFLECQDHLLALALAHVEREVLDATCRGVAAAPERLRPVLDRLRSLFALDALVRDRGWFLEHGYVESAKSKAIQRLVHELCAELRPDAVALVDAFGIPDSVLAAPIAFGSLPG
ncbi:MAG TPA: acyl-CoA dehydrogenase [Thermoanaerobaculia bacterium]|nr:acyl-CoA dehydrogenase [Thermoanaerobaculia bacterium]